MSLIFVNVDDLDAKSQADVRLLRSVASDAQAKITNYLVRYDRWLDLLIVSRVDGTGNIYAYQFRAQTPHYRWN